jgi:hypothetical protein
MKIAHASTGRGGVGGVVDGTSSAGTAATPHGLSRAGGGEDRRAVVRAGEGEGGNGLKPTFTERVSMVEMAVLGYTQGPPKALEPRVAELEAKLGAQSSARQTIAARLAALEGAV